MTSYAEARWLPRGWAHLALQFAVWFGFYGAYQAARGAADRGVGEAFWNGTLVIETEHRLRMFVEPTVQDFVERSSVLVAATTYTYWLSQFAVVGIALLWIYFRHHERFADFRNWLIGANLLGLVGYVLMPTAPPRMFPEWGFTDTLSDLGSVNQQSDVVAFAANPYAAMPSMHVAFALMIGVTGYRLVKWRPARVFWLVYPLYISFVVIVTANHFWMDAAVGAVVAVASAYASAVLARARPDAWAFAGATA